MVEFQMRQMNADQRAELVANVVVATNALYPSRDPELVLSAALGDARPAGVLDRWVVSTPPETLAREVRRIQAGNWLYGEVTQSGTCVSGSVAPVARVRT